jgi:hypothetical protein
MCPWAITGRRDGKPFQHVNYFITTLRTSPKGLLRLVWQRRASWSTKSEKPVGHVESFAR